MAPPTPAPVGAMPPSPPPPVGMPGMMPPHPGQPAFDPTLAAGMAAGAMGGPPPTGPGDVPMPPSPAGPQASGPIGGPPSSVSYGPPPVPPPPQQDAGPPPMPGMISPAEAATPPSGGLEELQAPEMPPPDLSPGDVGPQAMAAGEVPAPASPFGGQPPVPVPRPTPSDRPAEDGSSLVAASSPPDVPMGGYTPPTPQPLGPQPGPGGPGGQGGPLPPPPDGGRPAPPPDAGKSAAAEPSGWDKFKGFWTTPMGGDPTNGALAAMGLAPQAPNRLQGLASALMGFGGNMLMASSSRDPAMRRNALGFGLLGAGQGWASPAQQYQQAMPGAVRGYLGLQAQLGRHAAPVVVGNALVDPATGRPIYQGPDKATKPQVFGSEATGYYSLGEDGKPQPLIPGHEPGMTPYQQAQSRREDERLALERQRFGLEQTRQATGADKPAPTLEERDRGLFQRVASTVASKGWGAVPADDLAAYNRSYREKATPRQTIDANGLVTTTTPDVTDLPVPPGYGPAPKPGIVTPPISGNQAKTALEAHQTVGPVLNNIDEVIKLVENSHPADRAYGPVRAQLDQRLQGLVSGAAILGNTGVVSTTEAANYAESFGGLTGVLAAGKAAAGYDQALTALKTLRDRTVDWRNAKLPRVSSEEDARRYPPGVPFLMPNGQVGVNPGDG
jgi:hypothetical protein